MYAYAENFVLPLSHDEVVHGTGSLFGKMPGDEWQKFANLRLLFAYMFSQPGKKLLFMGNEIAQWREWNHDGSLDWHLLDDAPHQQIQLLVGTLNHLYKSQPALHELDAEPAGFHWLEPDDSANSVLVYERVAKRDEDRVICALNFTPVPRTNYRVGVHRAGTYTELLNTDAVDFGGSGQGNFGAVEAVPIRAHRREFSINLTLPPLNTIILKRS